MKKITYLLSLLIVSSFFLYSCQLKAPSSNLDLSQKSDSITDMLNLSPTQTLPQSDVSLKDQINVQINTKYGPVVVELFKDQAPNTVENFLAKVQSDFYNGLTFHRVVEGFVAQGGDPTGTGAGGGKIDSELNNIPFTRSSLGLARTADTNKVSNDSQFFICLTQQACQHLTGDYVNFGQVIFGMEYVDQIKQGDLIIDIVPLTK